MKVAFFTLGCKVNQYETKAISALLESDGFCTVDLSDNPDIIVVNSCAVTAESERKTRQSVRRFKRQNPNAAVVLIGCVPQAFSDDSSRFADADIILGNSKPHDIVKAIKTYFNDGSKVIDISPHITGEEYNTPPISDFEGRTRAFMKIEDGCDRFCTYCIIPYARGRVRSRSLDDIKEEAKTLIEKGFREIVLTGINLSSYGKDNSLNLCDAVEAVADMGADRVRLGSLEPDLMTDEMLQRLSKIPAFCDQFHLSLQSGCDETLARMNRKYDTRFYKDIVTRIRRVFQNPSITTDIMVGFAGETDEEFRKSLEFAKEIGFAKSHIFIYSRRKGTFADKMPNQVDAAVKQERSRLMIESTLNSEKEFLNSQVGLVCSVLFETEDNGFYDGYTKNYTRVRVKSNKNLCGSIENVKITEAQDEFCLGEIEV